MELPSLITTKCTFILALALTLTTHRSAGEFYRDPWSIPPAFNAKPGPWDGFLKFSGCRAGQRVDGLSTLKSYLHSFGYIPAPPQDTGKFSDEFDETMESAVKLYQQNFRLNVTGELDDLTLQQMVRPRCGVADIINGTNTMANKTTPSSTFGTVAHYSFFQGHPRWPSYKKTLTYAFLPHNHLTDTIKCVFARAFARWSAVIPLNFTQTDDYYKADITIGFHSGDHGDGEAFDGVLGTLAHTFSPTNGRFHLDNAETWIVDGDITKSSVLTAVDLESVAVHEIGHALGLGHTPDVDAIMYPTIQTRTRKVELRDDDINGVQYLYGTNPTYNASNRQFHKCSGAGDGRGSFAGLVGLAAVVFCFFFY